LGTMAVPISACTARASDVYSPVVGCGMVNVLVIDLGGKAVGLAVMEMPDR
jgi:hypothetical protein